MSRSDDKRLDDIRDMCARVGLLVERGRAALDADEVLWLALERAIEIAGEAATQVSADTKAAYPSIAWKELAAVRVVLAHGYHRVDRELLWAIATEDLPTVAEALGPPDRPADDRR